MARPRVIKIGEGEVILKNLPKEKADEIVALLDPSTGLKDTPNKNLAEQVKAEAAADEPEMRFFAIGLCQHKNKWCYAKIAFDPATSTAKVESIKPQEDRDIAMERFKIEAVSLGIIN